MSREPAPRPLLALVSLNSSLLSVQEISVSIWPLLTFVNKPVVCTP